MPPRFGGDPKRIAVGGDSAGGNLAAVVAQMATDRGAPTVRYQLLIYPVTNYSYDTASYKNNGKNYLLTRGSMEWFWNHYSATPMTAKTLCLSAARTTVEQPSACVGTYS